LLFLKHQCSCWGKTCPNLKPKFCFPPQEYFCFPLIKEQVALTVGLMGQLSVEQKLLYLYK
jgi:hypothetical protein